MSLAGACVMLFVPSLWAHVMHRHTHTHVLGASNAAAERVRAEFVLSVAGTWRVPAGYVVTDTSDLSPIYIFPF